jgi:hypothetical protein
MPIEDCCPHAKVSSCTLSLFPFAFLKQLPLNARVTHTSLLLSFPHPHLRFLFTLSAVTDQRMLFAFESFPSAVTSSKSKRTEKKANFFQKNEENSTKGMG